MSEKTLREIVTEAVAELDEPTFALFTTFNFDPVFFEDYVLPVFSEGLDASTLSGMLAGDQFLRKMNTVVFYDADQLAQGRKRLSYGAGTGTARGTSLFPSQTDLFRQRRARFSTDRDLG